METRALEALIGLGGVFLIYSLLVTQLGELIAALLSTRARFLDLGVRSLVGTTLSKALWEHPIIKALRFTRLQIPSYLASDRFAETMLRLVGSDERDSAVKLDINKVPAEVRDTFTALLGDVEQPLDQAKERLKVAFDEVMERVQGAYKRHAQLVALVIALVLVVATNMDAVKMAQTLWTQPSVRQAAALMAQKQMDGCKVEAQKIVCDHFSELPAQTPQLWSMEEVRGLGVQGWLMKLFGLFLTTIAIALGAPFWFDVLTKVAPGLRLAGRRPSENSREP